MGVFYDRADGFAGFLGVGAQPYSDLACVARNFLLDENVNLGRLRGYFPCHSAPGSDAEWKQGHKAYLEDRVWLVGDISTLETNLDDLPETFRDADFGLAFTDAHEELEVLRVESLQVIAGLTNLSIAQVREAFRTFLNTRSRDSEAEVDAILDSLALYSQDRPTFAGFASDLDHLFGDTETADEPNWPNRLRNILGLIHYDPAQRGNQDIAIFRYPIGILRKARGRAGSLLGMPTVLDGSMNQAFCPPPKGERQGFAVDLSGSVEPVMEVVHPTPRYSSKHLFRLGVISEPPGELGPARGFHLTALRDRSGRTDYADTTDSDIL